MESPAAQRFARWKVECSNIFVAISVDMHQTNEAGISVLTLSGDLTVGKPAATLRQAVSGLETTGLTRVILDLANTKELDDDGLEAILYCGETLRQQGGGLRIINTGNIPGNPVVLGRLGLALPVFQDQQQAVDSFFPDRSLPLFDVLAFVEEEKGRGTRTTP